MDDKACDVRGWRFAARHGAALSSAARELLAREQLRLAPRVPLPEMVFADSALLVALPSNGLALSFGAAAALRLWAERHQGPDWDQTNFDFTYCSSYTGDIERVRVEPTTERLPLDKLRQHVEILFYDRVLLFEDDVRDVGEIYLEVKTRVMAFGFLVLCRYYCRVDGKSVSLRDTRYYHEFGQDFIWRDHETREATIPALRKSLYAHVSRTTDEEHFRQLDLSADAIYPVLPPKETPTLPLGQVPVLDVDSVTYPQSFAIARYAARLGGLYPADLVDGLKVDVVLETLVDVRSAAGEIRWRTTDETEKAEKTKKLLDETLPKAFGLIESYLAGPFLLGDTLTIADLAVFDVVENSLKPSFSDFDATKYAKIERLIAGVKANERIAAYLAK